MRDRPQLLADITALTNEQVRQAAVNAGFDLRDIERVGSRRGAAKQISRQDMLTFMIQNGVPPEEIPSLARPLDQWPYSKHMNVPSRLTPGGTPILVQRHEVGHSVMGGLHGIEQGGVASHHNVEMTPGAAAAAFMENPGLSDPQTGQLIPAKVIPVLDIQLEIGAAGVAINELLDGVPHQQNPGRHGDIRRAAQLMEAAGIPVADRPAVWDAFVERAIERLRPVADLIREEADRREENLSVDWHYSKARIDHIVEKARNAISLQQRELESAGQANLLRPVAGTPQAGGGRTAPGSAGSQGGGAGALAGAGKAEKLKPFRAPRFQYEVLVVDRQGNVAYDRITATGMMELDKLTKIRHPGARTAQVLNETRLGPPQQTQFPWSAAGGEARTRPRQPGSTVPLMRRTLPPEMRLDSPSLLDVAQLLNRATRSAIGFLRPGSAPAKMVGRAVDLLMEEAGYALQQANSGREWYKADVATHDRILQEELRPELKDPVKLSLFKFAEGILSAAHDPYTNFKPTLKAWDFYHKNGVFNPEQGLGFGKKPKSWGGIKMEAYGNAFRYLNALIDKYGEKGASEWLLSEHPTSELRQYNKDVPGKADEMQHGAMIFGDKRGPFALNLHGMEAPFTADRWVARTWNRWMGTLEWDKETGKLKPDAPRNPSERRLMKQSFTEAAQTLGMGVSELQAVMWYYEQRLYTRLGAVSESGNFAAAARRVADEEAAATRPSARQSSAPPRSGGRTSGGPGRSP